MHDMGGDMTTYIVSFEGRRIGAIGIFYKILVPIVAESEEQMVDQIEQKYERISPIRVVEVIDELE